MREVRSFLGAVPPGYRPTPTETYVIVVLEAGRPSPRCRQGPGASPSPSACGLALCVLLLFSHGDTSLESGPTQVIRDSLISRSVT